MILTKHALKVYKLLLPDEKISLLNVIKVSNNGMFVQNRDLAVFISHIGKKFVENSLCDGNSIMKRVFNFSAETAKMILSKIKPDKVMKIYGEFANTKDYENQAISKGCADPENHVDRLEEILEAEKPEFFRVNTKRFCDVVEFLKIMTGRIEDLDTMEIAVAGDFFVIKTKSQETDQETVAYISKVRYKNDIKLSSSVE